MVLWKVWATWVLVATESESLQEMVPKSGLGIHNEWISIPACKVCTSGEEGSDQWKPELALRFNGEQEMRGPDEGIMANTLAGPTVFVVTYYP